jgi:nitronate monooxygenase
MDGAATPPLVSAVTNAGGMGTLPLGFRTPDLALEQIKEVQAKTNGVFIANFVLNFPSLAYTTAIQAGVKAILFSWGLPDAYMLKQLRNADVRMGIQVSGGLGANKALELKPDFLVVQGVEAGGHVQGNKPISKALQEVLEVANDIPVVAAGGIATGADICKYLNLGAAAVILGTRFVATEESAAHSLYKEEIIKTKSASDTVLTVCLNKAWPNATHRLLRSNSTFRMWESAGRPPGPVYVANGTLLGNRPGEYDIVALDSDGSTTWERYIDVVPVESMLECDVNALGTYAGEGVGSINDIPSVEELMSRLVKEYNDCN